MAFALSNVASRENRNGAVQSRTVCFFRKIIKNEVSLMVGVHVEDIIVSGEQDLRDNRTVDRSFLSGVATFTTFFVNTPCLKEPQKRRTSVASL